jgi:L-aspartate oxidase
VAATDFLIIGSGIAGLRAAADLAAHGSVTILTKGDPAESNTGYAQGGIAAAVGPDDSTSLHAEDTIAAGDGLCEPEVVRVLVEDGVAYVRELIEWGAAFDREASGLPALGREAAHRVRRVLHARDATGREIGRLLWTRVASNPRIAVLNHARAVSLVTRGGRCIGADYRQGRHTRSCEARAVLLATGGAGQVYRETTNPAIATGDGVAMAWRAGARVADLEFVQFHPTVLAVTGAPRFLLSEALRGEGAHLLNRAGERFMARYDTAGELASRDLVSRAIVREAARTNAAVFLSLQHLDPDWVQARFPTIAEGCRSAGLDLARDLIPVGPAAHYVMGGVETDEWGRSSVPGLLAAGEVACTGAHGANRLASNSLLEGLVFGARAARAMLEPPRAGSLKRVRHVIDNADAEQIGPSEVMTRPEGAVTLEIVQSLRTLMWEAAGVIRDREHLTGAVETLGVITRWLDAQGAATGEEAEARLHSLATVGWLIARAALRRHESRGAHFRRDYPARDDLHWQVHVAESVRLG